MREDFNIPNMGDAPKDYDYSYLNRTIRNLEMTFQLMRSKGPGRFSEITTDNLTVTGTYNGPAGTLPANITGVANITITQKYTGGSLLISGASTLNNVTAHGNLQVDGNETVGGTLTVGGIQTFSGATGMASFTTSGNGSVTGTMTSGTSAVTNNETVGGTLGVTGNTSLTTMTATGLITATGGQIKFPATQVPSSDANTLDDYEENTWTPIAAANSGTITAYTASGTYVKIGKRVFFDCVINISNNGTGAGYLSITGLPFTIGVNTIAFCREVALTGTGGTGNLSAGNSSIELTTYNNLYPGGTGYSLRIAGNYSV